MDAHAKTAAQFADTAVLYATSKGHADSGVLGRLVDLVTPSPTDRVLDVATGPGHVALAIAPRVASVVAFDLTPSMLTFVEAEAQRRGLTNVSTVQGAAENMPFENESFDIVTTRLGAHHFPDLPAALAEFARVLRPGGKLLVADITVPEDDHLDAEINRIEILRDPSHVRNHRVSEWVVMVQTAGFNVSYQEVGWFGNGLAMEIEGWMDRINTPQENRPLIRKAFAEASPELRQALKINDERTSFQLMELTLLGVKR